MPRLIFMELSKRLLTAARLVRRGAYVADVGCDHGLLTAYLIIEGIAARAVASDINRKPLDKARELFESLKITDRASVVLADGLDKTDSAVSDIVIAGMGADAIARIIGRAAWLKNKHKRLILVPATKHERLRDYLAASGFSIVSETAVCERGHFYTVIAAEYIGGSRSLCARERYIGSMDVADECGKRYIAHQKAKLEKKLQGLLFAASPDTDEIGRVRSALYEIGELI